MTINLIFLLVFITKISCFWPPPHEIKLEDSETFVISEISDEFITDEDEMIPIKASPNQGKYSKIHQLALKYNKREFSENKYTISNITKFKEHNFDLEEPIPWQGGFVDKKGNFIQPDNENVYYLNEMAKSIIDSKIERKRENEDKNEDKDENYDYNNFKAEYQSEIEKVRKLNETFNYTDVKEDESLAEAAEDIVEVKEPKNCTEEERKGIGLAAIKCIVKDAKKLENKKSIQGVLINILRITLIWFGVYIIIAIPCWCQKGWCCCCCCCRICKPRETIDDAKRFFTRNDIGVYHTKNGEKIVYQPTIYEISAQNRLEKALFNL